MRAKLKSSVGAGSAVAALLDALSSAGGSRMRKSVTPGQVALGWDNQAGPQRYLEPSAMSAAVAFPLVPMSAGLSSVEIHLHWWPSVLLATSADLEPA